MVANVSFRPQITMAQPDIKQAQARNFKVRMNEVESDAKNNQITDISAMTQRMQLESQLNDTKVEPVKYVEDTQPKSIQTVQSIESAAEIKPNNVTDVIAKFHKGKQPSKVEQSQVLTNQMSMMAASNMVLHGLF